MTPQNIVDYLNELLEIDASAIESLILKTVSCNEKLSEHPTVVVDRKFGGWSIGPLGLLNGLFKGVELSNGGYMAPIVAVFEYGRLIRFEIFSEEKVLNESSGTIYVS